MEKTETYHFVIFFFVFFSTFFSLSGIRTHILLFTLPLALVRSDAVAAAVAVLVPPVAAAHRHLLFFFYYHLPKSILRLCWYLLHTFNNSGRSHYSLETSFSLSIPTAAGLFIPNYFWFLPYWKTNSNSKPTNKYLIPNSPTLADGHAWCSLHSLRYVYQFLIHILFDIFSNSFFMFCVCWSSLSRALRHVFFRVVDSFMYISGIRPEEAHETMKWCVWWFLVFTCISQVFMAMSTGWRSCSTRKIRRSFKWRSRIKPNLVMEQKLAVELYWQTTHFVFSFWYNRSYDSPGQAETLWQTVAGYAL